MTTATDNLNCLKNLMQVICADGNIDPQEEAFLLRAAQEMEVQVDDWKALLREVLHDDVPLYPVQNRDRAVAALKAMAVMSKADGKITSSEKALAVQFAKSIGVSKTEWKQILSDIDLETLFEPFKKATGSIVVIRDDFDKLDAFLEVASDNGASVKTAGLCELLDAPGSPDGVVCFHAAEDKDATVTRCGMLLDKCGGKLVCILTRYQGHQVKYLLEIGLKKCVIEPVYERDITEIYKVK